MSPDGQTATRLSVDRPGEGERPTVRELVVVEGWAWAPEGSPRVEVLVGDRPAEVVPGGWRPDVSAALGIGQLRGYVATASASGLPAGPVEVIAKATGEDGVTVERRRTIEVAANGRAAPARPRPWAGLAERFDPKASPGTLTHVEHVARYRWAAQLAEGRAVLDAGCGVGFGAHILLAGGALSVTGVDAFAGAVVDAREQARAGLDFVLGDLRRLPFEDDAFDLAVCFEAVEHVAEQAAVVAELARTLRPGGVVAMSTPVPGAIAVHNPHHVADLTPTDLERHLRRAFANVELYPQHSALASLIDIGVTRDRMTRSTPPLDWTTGPIEPLYYLALASDGELPRPAPLGALAAGYDLGALASHSYELQDDIAEARAGAAAHRARAERAELAFRALEQRYAELEQEHAALAASQQDLEEARRALEQRLAAAEEDLRTICASRSWELTRPLRAGAARWRSSRGS